MTRRISELFGMDIYSSSGNYKGKVHDLIINVQEGRVTTITTDSLSNKLRIRALTEAEQIMREKSIDYNKVMAVQDVVLVNSSPGTAAIAVQPTEQPQQTNDAAVRRLRLRRNI